MLHSTGTAAKKPVFSTRAFGTPRKDFRKPAPALANSIRFKLGVASVRNAMEDVGLSHPVPGDLLKVKCMARSLAGYGTPSRVESEHVGRFTPESKRLAEIRYRKQNKPRLMPYNLPTPDEALTTYAPVLFTQYTTRLYATTQLFVDLAKERNLLSGWSNPVIALSCLLMACRVLHMRADLELKWFSSYGVYRHAIRAGYNVLWMQRKRLRNIVRPYMKLKHLPEPRTARGRKDLIWLSRDETKTTYEEKYHLIRRQPINMESRLRECETIECGVTNTTLASLERLSVPLDELARSMFNAASIQV